MRPLWKDILAAVWLGLILPGIVLNAVVLLQDRQQEPIAQVQAAEASHLPMLLRHSDGSVAEMDMDAYLAGVVLAEMPADFAEEALKAQSVAARTYTYKAYTTGGKHGDGSVCTDPACCQAYITEESYLSRGGTQENLEKVSQSVQSTSDMVMAYQGELIEATYFSSSGGSTEAAQAVWGADYPYLRSVPSPEEEDVVTATFTEAEFQDLLGKELTENPEEWFGPVTYTQGGGVASLEICGETYSGVVLRSLLGLRSTVFQMQAEEGMITVTTSGYGHRVGMSQYGANTMANNGSTWQEILQHYYPGMNLISMG